MWVVHLNQTYHPAVGAGKLARSTWAALRSRLPAIAVVDGPSMEPVLRSGDWVLLVPRRRPPAVGSVVVVDHPLRPGMELVKRVEEMVGPAEDLWLLGDNRSATTDSRQFGPVPIELLHGRAVARLRRWPPVWLRPRRSTGA